MNLGRYIGRQLADAIRAWMYPDRLNVNCWLWCQTHDWGAGDHGWATKECHRCGRCVTGCGL